MSRLHRAPVLRGVRVSARAAFLASACSFAALSVSAPAQSSSANDAPPSGEVIQLSAFEVRADKPTRYQAAEATSGGRISTTLQDTPGSISVITSELLQDLGANRLLDAIKLVPGVTEGITPNGLERVTIRGFQSDYTVTDGFRTGQGQMNTDPALIDRIEVMKGPNAILQPQGTPGGTVNAVTKSPSFQTGGYVMGEVGQYDSNKAVVDYNGVLKANALAYRVIGSFQDGEGYWDETYTRRLALAPSLLWQFGQASRLTLKVLASDYEVATYGGLPLDPSVGTNDEAKLIAGIDRRANLRGEEETRQDKRLDYSAFFTTKFGENLSMRVAARYLDLYTQALGTNPALAAGGAVNPLTGEWVGGTVFGPAPAYTPSPAAPVVTNNQLRSGGDTRTWFETYNFQNDFAYIRDFSSVRSTTTAGYAYAKSESEAKGRTGTRGSIDVLNSRASADIPTTFGPTTSYTFATGEQDQFYVQEQLTLFDSRLIVSGGWSGLWASSDRDQKLLVPYRGVERIPESRIDSYNYGVVYKVIPSVSLYYGHSENATLTGNYEGVAAGTAPLFAEGIQDEFGVKASFADGRITVSLAYFDITQTQFGVDDPRNYTSPPPVPRYPFIFFDRTAKGWELSVNAAITRNLTFIGNYYDAKNRDPNDIPFQASADQSGAAFLRYDFLDGAAKGLGFSLGVDYLGKRPGVQASGYTAASTSANLIPNLPSFYVAPRTLLGLGVYYQRGHYTAQLNVDNILNEEYLTGTFTRTGVWVGTPLNARVSLTYRF